jgi:hypothetical protein
MVIILLPSAGRAYFRRTDSKEWRWHFLCNHSGMYDMRLVAKMGQAHYWSSHQRNFSSFIIQFEELKMETIRRTPQTVHRTTRGSPPG